MWDTIIFSLTILLLLVSEFQIIRAARSAAVKRYRLVLGFAVLLLIILNSILLYVSLDSKPVDTYGLAVAVVSLSSAILLVASLSLLGITYRDLKSLLMQEKKDSDQYRSIVNNIPLPLVLKDRYKVYLVSNPAFDKLLGKESQTIIGKKDTDFFPRSLANSFQRSDEQVMEQHIIHKSEQEVTAAEGKKWLQLTRVPTTDENGSVSGILLTGEDISKWKQIETELEQVKKEHQETLNEKEKIINSLNFIEKLECLLASISTSFISTEPEKIDQSIQNALRSISLQAGVDRCSIFHFSKNRTDLRSTYGWYANGNHSKPENLRRLVGADILWADFDQTEIIHIPDVNLLDPQHFQSAEFIRARGFHSLTAVPLISDRSVIGYLWMESEERGIDWSPGVLNVFDMAGQMFVHVLERKREAEELVSTSATMSARLDILEQRNLEHTLLNEMSDLLQVCRTVHEAYPIIARYIKQLIPFCSGGLYVIHTVDDPAEKVAEWGAEVPGSVEQDLAINDCWALRRGRLHLVIDPTSGLNCSHIKPPLPDSYLCTPLIAQGETIGLLHLRSETETVLDTENMSSSEHAPTLEEYRHGALMFAEHIALALSNLSLRDKLRSQAIRDPLTGLFNRRYMEETLEREIRRATRHGFPIGIIMIDVDNLKSINDTHGHDAGDILLQTLGSLLVRVFRGEDVACRFGGDEFTVILPEASMTEVFRRAEQLREAFKKLELTHEGINFNPATLSIGVAAYPDHGSNAERLLQVSDMAAYSAKTQGRDRVVIGGAVDE